MKPPAATLRAALAAIAMAPLAGCAEETPQSPETEEIVYTLRGRVEEIPTPGRLASEFRVHHEEIPSFRREDGLLGMHEMIMPFPPAEGVSLESIAPGDIVEIDLTVLYTPEGAIKSMLATRVMVLPKDTPLAISKP